MTICGYSGYHPISSQQSIDKVPPSISPEEFYKNYVTARKPCIITGLPTDEDFLLSQFGRTKKSFLKEALENIEGFSETIVKVEQKSDMTGTFGTADQQKLKMSIGNLVDCLCDEEKGENFYLTTQYSDSEGSSEEHEADHEEEGGISTSITSAKSKRKRRSATREKTRALNSLLPEPIPSLLPYIPIVPDLLSNLVPQQLNMWMGKSSNGTSSGLHHDFHDNLYILLQGKKRFTLFSPQDAPFLYTYGDVALIHSNGLICYNPPGYMEEPCSSSSRKTTKHPAHISRGDGALPEDVARWKLQVAKARLEAYKSLVESRQLRNKGKARSQQEELESAVSEAIEELMDVLGDSFKVEDVESDFSCGSDLEEDFEREFGEESEQGSLSIVESEHFEEMMTGKVVVETHSIGSLVLEEVAPSVVDSDEGVVDFETEDSDVDNYEGDSEEGELLPEPDSDEDAEMDWNAPDDYDQIFGEEEQSEQSENPEPPSFSMVPVDCLYDFLQKKGIASYDHDESGSYEDQFPLLKFSTPVTIELKAGEMLYLPSSWFHEVTSFSDASKKTRSDQLAKIHVALNYWFYPPTASSSEETPYPDSFWEFKFSEITEDLADDNIEAEIVEEQPRKMVRKY